MTGTSTVYISGAINMVLSVVEIDILDKWLQAMISGVGVS